MRYLTIACAVLFLAGCGREGRESAADMKEAEIPRPLPADESRRFPKQGLVETSVTADPIWGRPFMPGGTTARYKQHEAFVARAPTATDAAFLLLDWKKTLDNAKLVPSFGGYFGKDGETPVFVFTKGEWIAGIRGLNEKQADLQARTLAAQLN
jgi:hypothetical protein